MKRHTGAKKDRRSTACHGIPGIAADGRLSDRGAAGIRRRGLRRDLGSGQAHSPRRPGLRKGRPNGYR
ncbi:hypothetical protein [Paenibacillus sp. sgz302251]|uniref:hypothetical protein n=1 Tax=Paenibacillus sp. sgz302251 TaxID=3414493 RepID=UPI003C7BA964